MEHLPGGNYSADQNEDGTWNIRGVPIFAECEFPLPRGGTFNFTRSWLEQAIKAAQTKEHQENFMGRVHVHHHGEGEAQVLDAGYLRPTHVDDIQVDGERKAALFADLLCVPAEVYDLIKSRRLPYRSIEAVPQDGFIDSLALMPTKAPFHRLPMLSIGAERKAVAGVTNDTEEVTEAPVGSGALVACFSRAHAIAALSNFDKESKPMTDLPFEKQDKPIKAMADDGESDSGSDEQVQAKEGGEGGGWKQPFDALKSANISVEEIPDVVAAIREFADSLESSAATEEPDEAPTMPEEGPVEMADGRVVSTSVNGDTVRADAKIALLQGKVEKMEAEKKLDETVKAAAKRLTRYPLGSDPEETLRAYAVKHGLARFAGFVEAIEEHGQPAPSESDFDPNRANLPEEIAKYTDPNHISAAKTAMNTYDALPQSARRAMTRERFIELQVAKIGSK